MFAVLNIDSNFLSSLFDHAFQEVPRHSFDVGLGLVYMLQILPRLANLTIVHAILDNSLSLVDFLIYQISYFHEVPTDGFFGIRQEHLEDLICRKARYVRAYAHCELRLMKVFHRFYVE